MKTITLCFVMDEQTRERGCLTLVFANTYHEISHAEFVYSHQKRQLTYVRTKGAICPFPHRVSSRRQCADVHLQLALRPPKWRHDGPSSGRHRCRAQHRSLGELDFRGAQVAQP